MPSINIGLKVTAQNQTGAALAGVNRNLRQMEAQSHNTGRALRTLQGIMLGAMFYGSARLARNFIEVAGSLESLQIRMAGVSGSMEKGNAIFDDMLDRFRSAPFDIEKVAQGFSRVAATGLSLEKTARLSSALVDAVAVFGGGSNELERGFIGFAQVLGKGSLQMEELRQQIGEQIPAAMQLMAKESGVSVAQFVADVTNGLISGRRAVELFTAASEKAYGGFAQNLKFTIRGSQAQVQTAFKEGMVNLLRDTDIDSRIAVTFIHISQAIEKFMASIDQADVTKFWNELSKVADVAIKATEAIMNIAKAVAPLIDIVVSAVNAMPQEALEFGMLGYMIMGRKGALIGAAVGAVIAQVKELDGYLWTTSGETQRVRDPAINALFRGNRPQDTGGSNPNNPLIMSQEKIDWAQKAAADAAAGIKAASAIESFGVAGQKAIGQLTTLDNSLRASAAGAMVPWADDVMRANQRLRELGMLLEDDRAKLSALQQMSADGLRKHMTGGLNEQEEDSLKALTQGLGAVDAVIANIQKNTARVAAQAKAEFRDKLEDAVVRVTDRIITMGAALNNNPLEVAFDAINRQANGLKLVLGEIVEDATLAGMVDIVAEAKLALQQTEATAAALEDQARSLVGLAQQRLAIESDITNNKLQQELIDARIANDNSISGNFLRGTPGGELASSMQGRELELMQKSLDISLEINALDTLRNTKGTTPRQIADIEKLIAAYVELDDLTFTARQNLSAEVEIAKEAWGSLGDIMHNGVGSAIQGLIEGTQTFGDVTRQVYSQITSLAINYLLKLAEIKLSESGIGAISGGKSGEAGAFGLIGTVLGLFGGSKGAVGAGNSAINASSLPTSMFAADGAVISGPQFVVGGEAGPEAVMPLTRVGGKLGVMSAGGAGGDSYNFNISAIDTQTGVQFLMKNIDNIAAGMSHRKALNRMR